MDHRLQCFPQDNIYAGIISIGAIVVGGGLDAKGDFPEGMLTIKTSEVNDAHWKLHEQRVTVELIL